MKALYLLVDLGSLAIPLLLSFEKRVDYVSKWRYLFPAILIVGFGFIVWDIFFHNMGIWSFNDEYLLGIRFLGLPLEEYLFFFAIPFSCVFIYEVMRYFKPVADFDRHSKKVTMALATVSALLAAVYLDRWYSGVTYILCTAVLYFIALRNPKWLGLFLRSFMVVLIPFFIVNGILTFMPVVLYNDLENIGLRMGSIPVEDMAYGFLLLILVTWFYETFKNGQSDLKA